MNNENKNTTQETNDTKNKIAKKRKKNLYVPDEEILAYIKAQKETNTTDNEDVIADDTVNTEAVEIKEISNQVNIEGTVSLDENNNANSSADVTKPTKSVFFIKALTYLKKILPNKTDIPKTIAIKITSMVLAVAIVASAVYLTMYFIDIRQQDSIISETRQTYELNRNDYTYNEDNQFSKFDTLKTQNPDVVGWITIPNTEVDNPVYQTNDNQYYVTHDMNKENNSYGAIFLDYRSNINPVSLTQNQIIYGHNMRYGAMFGTLKNYRNIDFYKQNPIIMFDSLYEKRVYKIFAIMIVNDTEDDTFGYSYSPYRPLFTSQNDFMQWIDHSRQRSLFDINVDVKPQDEIITLSTCCYDYENARFVLLGRLVRDGEQETVNTADAVINTDVIYSKKYYNKKGLTVPVLN